MSLFLDCIVPRCPGRMTFTDVNGVRKGRFSLVLMLGKFGDILWIKIEICNRRLRLLYFSTLLFLVWFLFGGMGMSGLEKSCSFGARNFLNKV